MQLGPVVLLWQLSMSHAFLKVCSHTSRSLYIHAYIYPTTALIARPAVPPALPHHSYQCLPSSLLLLSFCYYLGPAALEAASPIIDNNNNSNDGSSSSNPSLHHARGEDKNLTDAGKTMLALGLIGAFAVLAVMAVWIWKATNPSRFFSLQVGR